jgi:sugar lactone lactonase YvrE
MWAADRAPRRQSPQRTSRRIKESKKMLELTAAPVLEHRANLGEGAIWDHHKQLLYWVDINNNHVFVFDPKTNTNTTIDVHDRPGTIVPRSSGGMMIALPRGFASIDTTTGLVKYEREVPTKPNLRFNDGKCDPQGRFWAGTISNEGRPGGASLYRLDHDLSHRRMLEDVTNSNGIVWSHDSTTMYYIDTPTRRVDAFDFDAATGAISNRRPAIYVDPALGHPDGMTIDKDGMLWVALYGGGKVARFDPVSGQHIGTVHVPGARNITSVAFGDADLRTLYITTAAQGADLETHPRSGHLFAVKTPVSGVPAVGFKG